MATVYWFGGSGNWSDHANHWSNNSGNSPASLHGAAPGADDNVVFDSLSNATAYTVTVDASATCLDFTMGAPLAGKVTWAGSATLTISGSLNLSGGTAGITMTFTGGITFNATSGTKTIDFNSVPNYTTITLNGSGGTFQLARDLIYTVPTSNGSYLSLTAGTFDANGKTVTINNKAGVFFSGNFTGSSSFYNLTIVGYAGKISPFRLSGNITVTHTLLIDGNSVVNRLLVYSDTIGTPRTITITGTTGNSFSNVDFKDITMVTGGADLDLSAITGKSGDCGGNTGITFTTPVTTNWESGATWSTATWSVRVPLPQDTATFTTAGTATITQDMPRIGSVDFTGSADKTWTTSTAASCFGSINLTDLAVLTASTQTYTFEGRGNYTLTSAGQSWSKSFVLNAPGGVLTFSGNFVTSSARSWSATNGTLDARTYNVNVNVGFVGISAGGTINMGSGTWELLAGGTTIWNNTAGGTINADTSTIKMTENGTNNNIIFAGGSKVYYNVWLSRGSNTGTLTISGSNTFNQLRRTGTEAHSVLFTVGTTQTLSPSDPMTNPFDVNGSAGKLITINSTTTGSFTLVLGKVWRNVVCEYLNIQHCIATTSSPYQWYAGKTSVNNQATTTAGRGWLFLEAPRHVKIFKDKFYAVLKRWDGKGWIDTKLKYQGQPVNLKIYDNDWKTIK